MADVFKPNACILCECNCGIEVQLGGEDDKHLVKIRGDRAHPSSQGYACEKAQRLDHYQNGRDRILLPQRRRPDGTFETIDWDTAIREVAERLTRLRDEFGGTSIFYYGGGGQGNHLPGAYSVSTRRVLGSRYRSSALAQEKTGEFWVNDRMLGTYVRGDFEHCEVAFFLGKNPWFSHSIPRARVTLREIAKDPHRKLIVVDPRRTKTAELADIHVQVRPGTDAWFMSALVAVLFEEDLVDGDFCDSNTAGLEDVRTRFTNVPIAEYCAHAGVEEAQVREVARVIGGASSVASFEDLGVQMNHHSTLVSYLHKLTWLLTGNFGKAGTQFIPTPIVNIADGKTKRDSPVTGSRIVGGLVPCNAIADEILTDHPDRFRAMIVEAANPAHSLADAPRMREALGALDTLVVIDVAMTETARLADYVLPASTQFEKAEATFFNIDFPKNFFHLRPPLFAAPEGPLPEAEIHARLVEAIQTFDDEPFASLRAAADEGLEAYAAKFMETVAFDGKLNVIAPYVLYRTLGPSLGELAEGAVLWGLALQVAAKYPASLARAGFEGSPVDAANAMFRAILERPSGTIFAVDDWSEVLKRVGTPDRKIQLALDDLLDELGKLTEGPAAPDPEFPFTLSAGERRAFTANTIVRDPAWRKKDAAGALRVHPEDAAELGVGEGDRIWIQTHRGRAEVGVTLDDAMSRRHVSLPNGMGLAGDDASSGGIPTNELTTTAHKDPFVGTPWHKAVPARLER
ncbi:MAG: molybdopterin-dependent oxidoreductase [Deltaproteobacteria bacterium]